MIFYSISILVIIIFVVIIINKKKNLEEKQPDNSGLWSKIGISLLLFVPFFVVYYMLIAIGISVFLAITNMAGQAGWAYGIIGGFAISPILTIITIIKTVWRKR